jgi:Protein of unknown function (DUF4232)
VAFVLVLALAACDGGGAQEAGPVPTASNPSSESTPATTTTPPTGGSTSTSRAEPELCSSQQARAKVAAQEGAAGTIRAVWKIRNTSAEPCRTFGYPGMDFRASNGWLDVQVHRGGMQDIDAPPPRVVVPAGGSLYFVSYWSDVDTDAGPCQEFDRAKVTLPDNFSSLQVAASGCLNPQSVRVGPVQSSPLGS